MSVSSSSFSKRTYKVILLGDSSTGKTSIIERFVNNKFEQKENPTIGIDFLGKNVPFNNSICRLQLWDTAGQQRFRSLIPSYLKDAVCAIFVFDQSKPQTVSSLQSWINLFQQNKADKAIMAICGNKSDLPQQFNLEVTKELCKKYKLIYFQCSALTGEGIESMFLGIISEIQQAQGKKKKKIEEVDIMGPLTHQSLKQACTLTLKIETLKQPSKQNSSCSC